MDNLKDSILTAKENNTLSPLQVKQYEIQLEWLKNDLVPDLETLVFSKGLVQPREDRSYFILQTGIQVGSENTLMLRILTIQTTF